MNRRRLWMGAAIASVVLWLFDLGNLILTQRLLVTEPNLQWNEMPPIAGSLVIPSIVTGFLLMWLYVLARPRLGPGPKTAFVMASIGFALANPHFFGVAIWLSYPAQVLFQLIALWSKFAAATYLAGWQYIEQAP